jgi:hypothetical protein
MGAMDKEERSRAEIIIYELATMIEAGKEKE